MQHHDVFVTIFCRPTTHRSRLVFIQNLCAVQVLFWRRKPIGGAAVGVDQRNLGLNKQIVKRCGRLGGTQRRYDRQHVVACDELAGYSDCTLRVVGVVFNDQRKLAPLDAAAIVHHVQVGFNAGAQWHAISCKRTRQGHPGS